MIWGCTRGVGGQEMHVFKGIWGGGSTSEGAPLTWIYSDEETWRLRVRNLQLQHTCVCAGQTSWLRPQRDFCVLSGGAGRERDALFPFLSQI